MTETGDRHDVLNGEGAQRASRGIGVVAYCKAHLVRPRVIIDMCELSGLLPFGYVPVPEIHHVQKIVLVRIGIAAESGESDLVVLEYISVRNAQRYVGFDVDHRNVRDPFPRVLVVIRHLQHRSEVPRLRVYVLYIGAGKHRARDSVAEGPLERESVLVRLRIGSLAHEGEDRILLAYHVRSARTPGGDICDFDGMYGGIHRTVPVLDPQRDIIGALVGVNV